MIQLEASRLAPIHLSRHPLVRFAALAFYIPLLMPLAELGIDLGTVTFQAYFNNILVGRERFYF